MNSATEMKVTKKQNTQKSTEKIRVQFDFSPDSFENLENLVKVFGASSKAEVIRRALTLLTDALEEEDKGGKLGFRKSDGTFEAIRFY